MDYEEGTEYVLTAPRCRASWRVQVGNAFVLKSKRIKRGEVISDVPEDQVARLVNMSHAVPKDEWDPAEFRKASAARRQAMQQFAASDAASAVREAAKRGNGQPVVGLADADAHEIDGIKVDDVDDLDENGKPKQASAPDSDDAPVGDEVTDNYDDLPYAELVKTAKTITGNGGGSADELKARLREHDANAQ
jgi:hypothetical protein